MCSSCLLTLNSAAVTSGNPCDTRKFIGKVCSLFPLPTTHNGNLIWSLSDITVATAPNGSNKIRRPGILPGNSKIQDARQDAGATGLIGRHGRIDLRSPGMDTTSNVDRVEAGLTHQLDRRSTSAAQLAVDDIHGIRIKFVQVRREIIQRD